MPIIEIKHLYKTYTGNDRPAVADLCLSVAEGEIFGLLGANGAGKTTTLSILCGLRQYNAGEVNIAGHAVNTDMEAIKPLIGVVPQDFALYPELTAEENLKIFGGLYGLERKLLADRIGNLLSIFSLYDCRQRRISQYSGGMKRRVNLIAGLLHHPRLLFLDEPTVGIDVKSRHVIIDNLLKTNAEGCTLVYTSHLMEEAETLCRHVALMQDGRLIAEGDPKQLVADKNATSLDDLCMTLLK